MHYIILHSITFHNLTFYKSKKKDCKTKKMNVYLKIYLEYILHERNLELNI